MMSEGRTRDTPRTHESNSSLSAVQLQPPRRDRGEEEAKEEQDSVVDASSVAETERSFASTIPPELPPKIEDQNPRVMMKTSLKKSASAAAAATTITRINVDNVAKAGGMPSFASTIPVELPPTLENEGTGTKEHFHTRASITSVSTNTVQELDQFGDLEDVERAQRQRDSHRETYPAPDSSPASIRPGAQRIPGTVGMGTRMEARMDSGMESSTRTNNSDVLIAAVAVDDDVYSAEPVNSIRMNDNYGGDEKIKRRSLYILFAAVLVLTIVATATLAVFLVSPSSSGPSDVAASVPTEVPSGSPSSSPIINRSPTLVTIVASDVLKCGIPEELEGFHTITNGNSQGFEVDMCRAIAAAIFGPFYRNHLDLLTVSRVNRFTMLNNGDVDVLAAHTTFTMERNVHEPSTQKGYAFSEPYLHDNLGFGGIPEFVDCAARQDTTSTNCIVLGDYEEIYDRSLQSTVPRSGANRLNTIP